ncbi:GNAT family N-acetyltransferase [Saliterribacillus persicus]|nr:GNAT family N-acetyltransferase [Saliterribacillus persicus]
MIQKIRAATKEDKVAIAEVHVQSWKATYQDLINEQDISNTTVDHRITLWETVLSLPKERQPVFVMEVAGQIIGFISGGSERTKRFGIDGEIYAIYLLPEFQQKGMGRELLRTFAEEMDKLGYRSLLVWVLTQNPSNQFYIKYGAEKIEEEATTIGEGTYQETAYGFKDIRKLLNNLKV